MTRYVVGVGARRGVGFGEVDGLVERVLGEAGICADEVVAVGTVEAKAGERGIVRLVEERGWRLLIFGAATLAGTPGAASGGAASRAVGTGSVAEAAALAGAARRGAHGPPTAAAEAVLVVAKTRSAGATVAVARFKEET
ncbi:cobalamin biosynthesis protein [Actinocorallia sp. API 0066]|uniref:cobalamin biosynthesis protein n=1 Tax=Actinocorallia sp. API 0066 TaxID=2896846 RepID=UPI001E3E86AB|nr:cobalamin biosynthesis protein [Actinocorallia sp. API 0066]MCD0452782.1 cobalamin biosynthesis protein [Actinocorallia sp. API 0066]